MGRPTPSPKPAVPRDDADWGPVARLADLLVGGRRDWATLTVRLREAEPYGGLWGVASHEAVAGRVPADVHTAHVWEKPAVPLPPPAPPPTRTLAGLLADWFAGRLPPVPPPAPVREPVPAVPAVEAGPLRDCLARCHLWLTERNLSVLRGWLEPESDVPGDLAAVTHRSVGWALVAFALEERWRATPDDVASVLPPRYSLTGAAPGDLLALHIGAERLVRLGVPTTDADDVGRLGGLRTPGFLRVYPAALRQSPGDEGPGDLGPLLAGVRRLAEVNPLTQTIYPDVFGLIPPAGSLQPFVRLGPGKPAAQGLWLAQIARTLAAAVAGFPRPWSAGTRRGEPPTPAARLQVLAAIFREAFGQEAGRALLYRAWDLVFRRLLTAHATEVAEVLRARTPGDSLEFLASREGGPLHRAVVAGLLGAPEKELPPHSLTADQHEALRFLLDPPRLFDGDAGRTAFADALGLTEDEVDRIAHLFAEPGVAPHLPRIDAGPGAARCRPPREVLGRWSESLLNHLGPDTLPATDPGPTPSADVPPDLSLVEPTDGDHP